MATDKQIAALKYLITKSKQGNDLVKKILWLLIDASENLTRPVSISLVEKESGFTADELRSAAISWKTMVSCNLTTHLHALCELAGTNLFFSAHYGAYEESGEFSTEGMFSGIPREMASGHENDRDNMPVRYTFWLAEKTYGHSGQGHPVKATREEIETIDIYHDYLYGLHDIIKAG
jgi:hypothetical protein